MSQQTLSVLCPDTWASPLERNQLDFHVPVSASLCPGAPLEPATVLENSYSQDQCPANEGHQWCVHNQPHKRLTLKGCSMLAAGDSKQIPLVHTGDLLGGELLWLISLLLASTSWDLLPNKPCRLKALSLIKTHAMISQCLAKWMSLRTAVLEMPLATL